MKTFTATISLAATFNAALVLSMPSMPVARAATLWTPAVGTTWNYLIGVQDLTVATATASNASVIDLDLYVNSATVIAGIKAKGVKVICYFSAGTYEPNRPDSANFTAADKGKVLEDWPDEMWLKISNTNVVNIMLARIQLAADKGCDGIEPDNIDGYDNDNGLSLTMANSVTFVTTLAAKAASLNLAIGLKNSAGLISSLISKVQFAVNEECIDYTECDDWKPFITAKKPVFHVEYPSGVPNIKAANVPQYCVTSFSTILKDVDVTIATQFCPDGSQVVTSKTTG